MSWYHPKSLLDKFFEGGIIFKGVTGALEFLGGLLLLFVSPDQIHRFINFVTQQELIEDPHDRLANSLVHAGQQFTAGGRLFLIAYLWVHAAVKLIAVIGLLKNKLWAYPFALITLGLLMLYQVYTIIFDRVSIGMVLLTVFDVFILWLIWREYRKAMPSRTKSSS